MTEKRNKMEKELEHLRTSKVRQELATFNGIFKLQFQRLLLYGSYSTNAHVSKGPREGVKHHYHQIKQSL